MGIDIMCLQETGFGEADKANVSAALGRDWKAHHSLCLDNKWGVTTLFGGDCFKKPEVQRGASTEGR